MAFFDILVPDREGQKELYAAMDGGGGIKYES
jgi:hypothetical protein